MHTTLLIYRPLGDHHLYVVHNRLEDHHLYQVRGPLEDHHLYEYTTPQSIIQLREVCIEQLLPMRLVGLLSKVRFSKVSKSESFSDDMWITSHRRIACW